MHLATLLELLTPLFPHLFVYSASLSNIGKNVSWLATGATRAAINKTFLLGDNLGDLTAKSGAQSTAAGLIGTGLGVLLSYFMPSSHPFALVAAFTPIAALNTYAIYASCKSVVSKTLDVQRAELLFGSTVNRFLETGKLDVKTPEQISTTERFTLPPSHNARLAASYPSTSLLLEPPIETLPSWPDFEEVFPSSLASHYYLAILSDSRVCLWFSETASTTDSIKGYFHASLLRTLVLQHTVSDAQLEAEKFMKDIGEKLIEHLKARGWDTENAFLAEAGRRIKIER